MVPGGHDAATLRQMSTPAPHSPPYPQPPWRMQGQMWLTLFHARRGGPDRPAGVYGVGLVDYQEGSPLTYGELLVARQITVPAPEPTAGKHVTVTDIWVDSEPSRQGGRELWGVPKEIADFAWTRVGSSGMPATSAVVTAPDGTEIARAAYSSPRLLPPRVTFSGSTWQTKDDGTPVAAELTGSGRSFPVRGSWEFAAEGPLAWLRDARRLASVAMHDFRMVFG